MIHLFCLQEDRQNYTTKKVVAMANVLAILGGVGWVGFPFADHDTSDGGGGGGGWS